VPPDDPEDLDPGLARERTRLAWVRTAIAFAAVGAAVLKVQLSIGLIVLAMTPLVWATGHFATRAASPELLARRLLLVTVTVTMLAVLAVLIALLGHGPASLSQLLRPHGQGRPGG
jgi:uncharacterized membrane protein YidH (DUF202 family)